MRGIVLAWAVGLGLMTWRDVQEFHKPPIPGRLLGASGVFAALALLAEYEPARRAATAAAWAFDLAVVFQIGPKALTSTAGLGTGKTLPNVPPTKPTTGGGAPTPQTPSKG